MGFLPPVAAAAGSLFSAGGATAAGLSTLSTAATIGSTVLGAGGALMEGASQSSMYKYRAAVARNNAAIAEQNANQSLISGQREESQHRAKVTRLVSSQKAGQAASGVDVGVGSAPLVRDITQAEGDFDALAIRYNAAKESHAFRQQAQDFRAEASAMKKAARMSRLKSYIGAASSVVGGIGKYADMKMARNTSGLGGAAKASKVYTVER